MYYHAYSKKTKYRFTMYNINMILLLDRMAQLCVARMMCPMSHASLIPWWQAAEEARQDADGRAQRAEAVAEQRRAEARNLEEWLRKTQEESNLSKARLDSFMKAMGSLQDDRDHILVAYKQLEEKHLQVRSAARSHRLGLRQSSA